jgi:hypothetical protein
MIRVPVSALAHELAQRHSRDERLEPLGSAHFARRTETPFDLSNQGGPAEDWNNKIEENIATIGREQASIFPSNSIVQMHENGNGAPTLE